MAEDDELVDSGPQVEPRGETRDVIAQNVGFGSGREYDPVEYVWSLNRERRHLDQSQLAMVGARRKDIYEARAKERQKAGGGDKRSSKAKKSGRANLPEPVEVRARDQAGEAVGVSGRSVDHASKVIESGSKKLQAAVDSKTVAVSTAAKLEDIPT